MPDPASVAREVLPIPDRAYEGPVFEDAKDPAAKFPPIEPLRPPAGAPNVLIVLIDDAGFASSSAFGGPCQTPTAERLAGDGLKFSRFHTTALCSPTRAALLSGRNHHTVGMGGITEIATSAPGYNSVRPNTCAPLAETLKLNGYATAQFGKCHEVPVWETSPLGPFDSWPSGGGGFEYFYGFIGGETNQYYPAIYEGTTPGRARQDPGAGLPLHRGHDGPGDQVDPPAEGAHGGQALLRLLRARGDPRAASRGARVVGEVQGQVRPGLGRPARGDARAPEGARRDPARRRADRPARRDPRVGRDPRRPQARPRAPDGGLRRLPRAHRPPRRAARRLTRRPRRPRGHARLLHRRRQRRERRGRPPRQLQRADQPQRRRRIADDRVHGRADRQVRDPGCLQPLRRGLGARVGHAVPVDQAGRLALGRHAQRHDRPLARRHPGAAARCATSSTT